MQRGAAKSLGAAGNAKERRRLRRAQEQQEKQAEPEKEATNAKERRRLKRKALHESKEQEPTTPNTEATTSKERRKLRRAQERSVVPAPSSKKRERSGPPLVAFVGQLSFTTTASDLEKFFSDAGVPGTLRVRLLTSKESGKSRGMAFVECESAEALHAVVSLHRSTVDGRRVNIEKSSGGGKEIKKQRVEEKRQQQQSVVDETVKRVVADYVDQGKLRPDEFDEGVLKLLARRSGRVAEAALSEYCSLEGREKFYNPAAYLTKIVTRMTTDLAVANRSTLLDSTKKLQQLPHHPREKTKDTTSHGEREQRPSRDQGETSPHDLKSIFKALRK